MDNQELDFDIANYTREDALATFDLPLSSSLEDIKIKSDKIIKQAKHQEAYALVNFYEQLANKLLDNQLNTNDEEIYIDNNTNRGIVYDYKTIQKPGPDALDKYKNNITYPVTNIRGDKNPLFRNTIKSMILIDSKYRKTNSISSSDFLSTLSYPINNVIEYSIYDINIPYAWYNFSYANGNTTFILTIDDEENIVTIPDGNYASRFSLVNAIINSTSLIERDVNLLTELKNSLSSLITVLSDSLNSEPEPEPDADVILKLKADILTNENKIQFINTSTNKIVITFYDVTKECFENSDMNYNLGHHLGFINTDVNQTNSYSIELPYNENIISPFTVNIYGTKYLLLKVDDFSSNRPPSNLITTAGSITKCKYPDYFKRDLNFTRTGDNSTNIQVTSNNDGYTQAQITTMNAILEERSSNTEPKILGLESSNDILCKIPIPDEDALINTPNKIFTESGGYLSQFTRQFLGKVNILKIRTQLLDDKGRVVDLNGQDFSYSLVVNHLYQY